MKKDVRSDHARLLKNLRILQKLYSVSVLCDVCGFSRSTWFKKIAEPWKRFNYDEFRALCKYCDIDMMQLLEGDVKVI